MTPPTTTSEPRRRSFPGHGLLDLMATPHGIDRYIEQVSPTLVTSECRAEVLAAERGTEDSIPLPLRPTGSGTAPAPASSCRSRSRSTASATLAATRLPPRRAQPA